MIIRVMICCALCENTSLEGKDSQNKVGNTLKLVSGTKSRGISPVIGNLLLISLAVVGGTILFLYSESFISEAQISGKPSIESIKFVGFDARDEDSLMIHEGSMTPPNTGGIYEFASFYIKEEDERVAVYVQNNSAQKVTIAELRFAGKIYNFTGSSSVLDEYDGTSPGIGEFVILITASDLLLVSDTADIEAGQLVSLVIDLQDSIKIGRDAQLKLVTTTNSVWVDTITIGEQFG